MCVSNSWCDLESFIKPSFLLIDTCCFIVLQFQFVNSYLSLFYIGFYLKDMERLKEVSNISLSAFVGFFFSFLSSFFSSSFGFRHPSLLQSPILTSFALSAYMHWFRKPPIRTSTHMRPRGRCCWCCLSYGVCRGRSASICCLSSTSRSRCLWSLCPGSSERYSNPKYDTPRPCTNRRVKRSRVLQFNTACSLPGPEYEPLNLI